MKRLRRFLALRSADQGLLLLAGLLLATIKLGLRWLPIPITLRILGGLKANLKPKRIGSHPSRSYSSFRVVHAIDLASRHMPGGVSCLVRALVVQVLLGRQGSRSQLQIGVARGADGRFTAHAWVESNGQIVTGNRNDLHVYRVLHSQIEGRA